MKHLEFKESEILPQEFVEATELKGEQVLDLRWPEACLQNNAYDANFAIHLLNF